jgi:hypothetical protein
MGIFPFDTPPDPIPPGFLRGDVAAGLPFRRDFRAFPPQIRRA